MKIIEYDNCFYPHPDGFDHCEKSHECGEPCICEIGTKIADTNDKIRVYELMKIMGEKTEDHIVGYFTKAGKQENEFYFRNDGIELSGFDFFVKDAKITS